ncbi:hypothetical protein DPMN_086574 [Dreissena polymorpha]|uniref:Uncharacterized protein n=1 Tax=Dreissena polymorpha TaxID=45954 RepID=A0A9D4KSK2_DREPO|nr:hypothetical protein DPMN_086574 [Dreissena polymorpha]
MLYYTPSLHILISSLKGKEAATELSPVFTLFFQASLDQGTIPDDWKTAKM